MIIPICPMVSIPRCRSIWENFSHILGKIVIGIFVIINITKNQGKNLNEGNRPIRHFIKWWAPVFELERSKISKFVNQKY